MNHMKTERVSRVMAELEALCPGGQLLICDPWSILYLTGFYAQMYERFSGVLLRPDNQPVVFMNELYPIDPFDDAELVIFNDTDDVTSLLAAHIDASRPLGVDATMRAGFLLPLQERGVAASYVLASRALSRTRAHKDEVERDLMRAASAANDEVMAELPALLHDGVEERAVADRLLGIYRAHGCEGFSFDPIVSFGANAADPHHEPDATRLERGQVVLFDIGGRRQNYCSDMTRTFFWGEPDEESRRIYDVVRRANEAAEALVRPGVRFCDVDRCARRIIEDAGYGPFFTHRLGHSIGLEDHEPGDVSSANTDLIEPGMTFSIEPGIYLPGRTGVRIEDLVLVTEDGVEVLNHYSKEPCTLGR